MIYFNKIYKSGATCMDRQLDFSHLQQHYHHHSLYNLDINECPGGVGTHGCDGNATCTDNDGSYSCMCNVGYTGDGFVCNGKIILKFTCIKN